MKNTVIAALLASALSPLLLAAPATARPMTESDLATFNRLGAPAASPDGKWVAYQLTTTDLAANKRSTGLYLLDIASRNAQAIAIADSPGHNESAPVFARDGQHLYFLSNRSGTAQVWRVALPTGEPMQVTSSATDISGFSLSPDGARLAVWADVKQGCSLEGCADSKAKLAGSGREYDRLFVRHWDSWREPGTYSRIYAYTLGSDGKAAGAPRSISGSIEGDAPSKPFGGGEEIAWAADSSAIAFTIRKSDGDEPRSTNLDIVWQPLAEGAAAVNLTQANQATDSLPAASPDGKWLAWAAMARPGYESDRMVVHLRDMKTGKVSKLTEGWDRSAGSIAWGMDSKSLLVTAQDTLEHPVFRIDVPTGKVTRLTERGNVANVVPLAGGAMLYTVNSIAAPDDLVLMEKNGQTRRLTNVNADKLAGLDPVAYEKFSFKGANGDLVHGQIVKPQGAEGKLPIALLVHGGPQGSFGNSWSYRWNPAVMASQGYAAVTIDFHGSTGYGQAFTDSINKDWGGKPLQDLKLGMAALSGIDASLDTANACALGGSYGGYMMNWIAGQWPDGFKCLVTHAGVFDLRAMAFETEELWFDEWDHGGPWWQRQDAEKWNPVNHVTNWKTPTLVIHGEKDFRIPYSQSLAAFTALQRQGIESKLLIFPDENHWVLKAQNSVQWHRNVFDWLERHLKTSGK
ncbi:X-Pro dipeptidyl-peptidase family protein [Blastomonas sp. RAC04]|uniref:S9 family peptidase n=1 Tax=Blastomonas sp. RAC04 TaxID=1842535 RepID=UPI00083D181B|nr:S9 family peptidase [Blastomonas sp. RAC04]AOG00728.1 X-Pro dipeptidyl-peptidase family protein [Blastomonas sp. RAC04]